MSVLETSMRRPRTDGVDLAGTIWPLYKLEAVAAGFLTFAVVLLVTGAAQPAVLGAAAIATLTWWIRLARTRSAHDTTTRTTP